MIQSHERSTSVLCSMIMMECPISIKARKETKSFVMSWKCSPVVGSSKINKVFPCDLPLPKKEASFTRWASPPLNVLDDCPSFTYPNPTSDKGCMARAMELPIFSSDLKKDIASSTDISNTSCMFFSLNLTSSTSSLNFLPRQDSQGKCTSAKNCISITCSPSPLQVSHLPPSTLNEKKAGL